MYSHVYAVEARPTRPTPPSDPGNLVSKIFVLRSGNSGDAASQWNILDADSSHKTQSRRLCLQRPWWPLLILILVGYLINACTGTNPSCSLNTTLVSFASYHSLLHNVHIFTCQAAKYCTVGYPFLYEVAIFHAFLVKNLTIQAKYVLKNQCVYTVEYVR